MHQPAELSLREAATLLTEPRVLRELGHLGYDCRTRDELVAVLERSAAHATRASEGYAALGRYDMAAERRERARELRRWAAALLVVEAASCG